MHLEWVKALEPHALEWLKASGIPALAAAIAFASWRSTRSSNQWQVRIARQKLKHDLYDRWFAVYMAFHELMVAFTEKKDVDTELRKANEARAPSPFLFDTEATEYFAGLHTEAFRLILYIVVILVTTNHHDRRRRSRALECPDGNFELAVAKAS